jgi:hypothetical protein
MNSVVSENDSHPAQRSGRLWQPSADASVDVNYDIRTDHLVKARRDTPEFGWRKAVYAATFKMVNLGPSPFQRRLNAQKLLIASDIAGTYQIPVISIKGGVGRTRIVAGMGTVFGRFRTEPVIAIDADPTYGTLGSVVDPAAPGARAVRGVPAPRLAPRPKPGRKRCAAPAVAVRNVLAGRSNSARPGCSTRRAPHRRRWRCQRSPWATATLRRLRPWPAGR